MSAMREALVRSFKDKMTTGMNMNFDVAGGPDFWSLLEQHFKGGGDDLSKKRLFSAARG